MDMLQKNLAAVRGEAMGASLLAAAAIQTSMMLIPNREELLEGISAWIDDTLNQSRSSHGDPDDEYTTMVRETARNLVTQHLDGLWHSLKSPRPPKSPPLP
ncbi:hypothetical protein [Bradyrhizobium stylosanthis]|uniref:Uncharacterized protein n=1 Tax=Bradyrhizobium stylosanthis TaxID=1803665 RepID=A0A560DIL0_9BRAD|nr:hypothetical protein [Bradyrhizobium stylosanthis]TWA96955.1 hypothetical protein FBZ96_1066 [Bradyrhizobium stylosanthis]